jgi:hypothetical protein
LGLPNSCHDLISSPVVFELSLNWVQHEKVRIACCALGTISSWAIWHWVVVQLVNNGFDGTEWLYDQWIMGFMALNGCMISE